MEAATRASTASALGDGAGPAHTQRRRGGQPGHRAPEAQGLVEVVQQAVADDSVETACPEAGRQGR